jgi:site-specific recombinase XerC
MPHAGDPFSTPAPHMGADSMPKSPLAHQIEWYLDVLAARPASRCTVAVYRCELEHLERSMRSRGCSRAEDLTPELVRAGVVDLLHRGKPSSQSKGYEASARLMVTAVRGLLAELRKRGATVQDISSVATPRVPRRLQPRVDLVAFGELEQALDRRAAYSRFPRFELARDRALVQVLFETGLRSIEASRLDVGDVDLKRGVLTVREGKGRKPRQLGIADPDSPADGGETMRRLRAYLAERSKRPSARKERALWLGQRGRRMSPAALREVLRRLCEEAELPQNLPVHAFRRGWFTLAYQADPRELPVLAARMGWSEHSQAMVSVYTHGAIVELSSRPRRLVTRALAAD